MTRCSRFSRCGIAALWAAASIATQAAGAADYPRIPPAQAVELAASDPVNGVNGVFEFTVRGSGKDRRFVYLNSERDYRDQRCLTVTMTRGNAAKLAVRVGGSPQKALVGRRIRVTGTARRTRINIYSDRSRTGLYYYQTHVFVTDPDQIELLDEPQASSPVASAMRPQ